LSVSEENFNLKVEKLTVGDLGERQGTLTETTIKIELDDVKVKYDDDVDSTTVNSANKVSMEVPVGNDLFKEDPYLVLQTTVYHQKLDDIEST